MGPREARSEQRASRDRHADRLAQAQALQAVKKELFSSFGDTVGVQTFSAESKQGVEEARAVVAGWLGL